MAQPSTPQRAVGNGFDGIGQTAGAARAWSASALGRLRATVLPGDDNAALGNPRATTVGMDGGASKIMTIISRVLIGMAITLLLVAVGVLVFRAVYADRIYPAVVVGDVAVGGLTAAQAEERLAQRVTELEAGTVTFSYGGQTWTPTLTELGATVGDEAALAEAAALGRTGDAAGRLAFTGELLRSDQVVPLRTTVDGAVLSAWFDRVDRALGQPAVNAAIVVSGTQVTVSPEAAGVAVDRAAATAVIREALARLEPVAGPLPTQVDQPAITAADLVEVRDNVERAITTPMRVSFEDQAWTIDGETLSGYLFVETVLEGGRPRAEMSFDRDRLAADLRTQFVPEVNRDPVNARVGWNDDRGLVALDPSETGVTLRAGAFADAVTDGFLGGDMDIEIPVVITRPEIDAENLDALGIETRLGRGDSNFAGGSWERDENIYVATGLLNGTLVRPGELFSFNGAIGEITYDKGYQEASVVVAEQVGRGIGGGVCQVSTTVFRAAVYAGMPIVEWHPHTYRLTGYEAEGWGAGFDASILQYGSSPESWADLTFENTTGGWLLVEAWTAYPNVIVNIYGTDDGRQVEVEQWPLNGKTAGFSRVIYDAQGNVLAERAFASYFK